MNLLLSICTIVGGVAAVCFFWEKFPESQRHRFILFFHSVPSAIFLSKRHPSTQRKILEILADGPADYHKIRAHLREIYSSEVRPATVRAQLDALVEKGMLRLMDDERYALAKKCKQGVR